MISIKYFVKNAGICGSDFRNHEFTEKINPVYILSVSSLLRFELPFSEDFVGRYAKLTMSNNDYYFIKEKSYNDLISIL
jgi:hypothetical protein